MSKDILVVDLGQPKFLLLPFFLREDGFSVREARSMEDGEASLHTRVGDAVVLNTVAYPRDVARAVHCFREVAPTVRVVTMHFGPHTEAHQPVRAHLCVHSPAYVDDVIAPVTRFLNLVPKH